MHSVFFLDHTCHKLLLNSSNGHWGCCLINIVIGQWSLTISMINNTVVSEFFVSNFASNAYMCITVLFGILIKILYIDSLTLLFVSALVSCFQSIYYCFHHIVISLYICFIFPTCIWTLLLHSLNLLVMLSCYLVHSCLVSNTYSLIYSLI